jgi:DNA (cytosine-5)-methyltransferase 1
VPEFESWGPIGSTGRRMKSRRGEVFQAWLDALRSLGYTVGHRVLCAADYGDPTTRRRLFIQAVRGRRKIVWPQATHASDTTPGLFGIVGRPWVPARQIINWDLKGKSIFDRKKPLADNTLARIREGAAKFWPKPFLIAMEHGGRVLEVGKPLPTVTCAKGGAFGVCEPFLVQTNHKEKEAGRRNGRRVRSVTDPLPTVCGNRGEWSVVEPLIVPQHGGGQLRPVSEPVPTVATKGAISVVEPLLIEFYGNGRAQRVTDPLPTVTTKDRFGLARPVMAVDGRRYELDILFRMLQPAELAGAQGFPPHYHFEGTKSEVTKQIGNAVPRRLARALVAAMLSQNADVSYLADDELAVEGRAA